MADNALTLASGKLQKKTVLHDADKKGNSQ